LGIFISGDQVLPRITSNISVYPTEPDADPLGDWLASLAKVRRAVPASALVLPSHNDCFRGLHDRIDYMVSHHEAALDELRKLLATPMRAVDCFSALFHGSISGPFQSSLATGESLAHLNYLMHRGEVAMTVGADGVHRYQRR
jgi:glyoxylase-like metal-dependent hydrolase (beta-lactamase superfamily II)